MTIEKIEFVEAKVLTPKGLLTVSGSLKATVLVSESTFIKVTLTDSELTDIKTRIFAKAQAELDKLRQS